MDGWRKLHIKELCDLYSSPSIIIVIKWQSMRLVGNAARVEGGKKTMHIDYWKEGQREQPTREIKTYVSG
jgi:hypothetical protein